MPALTGFREEAPDLTGFLRHPSQHCPCKQVDVQFCDAGAGLARLWGPSALPGGWERRGLGQHLGSKDSQGLNPDLCSWENAFSGPSHRRLEMESL